MMLSAPCFALSAPVGLTLTFWRRKMTICVRLLGEEEELLFSNQSIKLSFLSGVGRNSSGFQR